MCRPMKYGLSLPVFERLTTRTKTAVMHTTVATEVYARPVRSS